MNEQVSKVNCYLTLASKLYGFGANMKVWFSLHTANCVALVFAQLVHEPKLAANITYQNIPSNNS